MLRNFESSISLFYKSVLNLLKFANLPLPNPAFNFSNFLLIKFCNSCGTTLFWKLYCGISCADGVSLFLFLSWQDSRWWIFCEQTHCSDFFQLYLKNIFQVLFMLNTCWQNNPTNIFGVRFSAFSCKVKFWSNHLQHLKTEVTWCSNFDASMKQDLLRAI